MAGTITDKGLERLRQQLLNRGVSADGAVVREIVSRGGFNVLDDYCEVKSREGTGKDVTVYRQIPDEQVMEYVTREQIGERRSYEPASERAGAPAPPPDEAPSEEIELSEGDFDEGDAPGLEAVPTGGGTSETFTSGRKDLEKLIEGAAGSASGSAEPLTPGQKYAERRKLVEEFVKATESYDTKTAGKLGAEYYSLLEKHFPGLSLHESGRPQWRENHCQFYALAAGVKTHGRAVEPSALFDRLENIAAGYQEVADKTELKGEQNPNVFMEYLSSIAWLGYTAPIHYLYAIPDLVKPVIDETIQRYKAYCALPAEQRTEATWAELSRFIQMEDVETRTYLERLRQTLGVPEYPKARERQRELEQKFREERGIEPVEPPRPNLALLEVPEVPAAATVSIEAAPPGGASTYTTGGHTATDGMPEPPPAEGVAPPAATSAGPAPTETTAVPPPEGAAPPAEEQAAPTRERRPTLDGIQTLAAGVDLTTEQNGRKRMPPPVPPAKPKPSRPLGMRAAYVGMGLLGALTVWYGVRLGAEYLSKLKLQPFPTPVTAAYHDAGIAADASRPEVARPSPVYPTSSDQRVLQGTLYYQILRNLTNPQELEQLAIRYLKEVKLGLPLTVKADSCAQAWERFFTLMTESNRVGLQASGLSADLTKYTHTRTKFGEKLSQQCKRDGGDYYRFSVGVEKPMRRKQR